MKKIPFVLFVLLATVGCEKEDNQSNTPSSPADNRVSLSNISVGQKSYYERYSGNCNSVDLNYQLTGDTLVLEVISEGGQLKLHEHFTEGSVNFSELSPRSYPVSKQDGYILIPAPERFESTLFFFYGNDTIWSNPSHDVNLVQNNCLVTMENGDPFIGEEIGHLPAWDIEVVSKTNKTAVSCVPGFFVDAYLIYDENSLEVSHVYSGGGLPDESSGWARIE